MSNTNTNNNNNTTTTTTTTTMAASMDHSRDDPQETALRQTLAKLDIQRRSMELEADAIYMELTTPPSEGVAPMGIDTPLVDFEGYPRGDVDLYRARELRQRFRVLQTDHRNIENQIQNLLYQLAALKNPQKKLEEERERQARLAPKPKPKFDPVTGKWVVMNWDGTVAGIKDGDKRNFEHLERQVSGLTADDDASLFSQEGDVDSNRNVSLLGEQQQQQQGPTTTTTTTTTITASNNTGTMSQQQQQRPFAKIDAVASDSPAEAAGLQVNDYIVTFGHLHADNHNHLKAIAELVPAAAAESKGITVQVQRQRQSQQEGDDEKELVCITLKPKPWNGRGLLGCHIVPL